MNTAPKKPLVAFPWFGGKTSHLGWLLPKLPTAGVQTYVEPFAGSLAVLLNRPPAPVEVANDLDGNVVNFFRVLRDRRRELYRAAALTPYHRAGFLADVRLLRDPAGADELERARAFFAAVRQCRTAAYLKGSWSRGVDVTRNGYAHEVSDYHAGVRSLRQVGRRLLRVQFESRDALRLLAEYDRPGTLFYLDPPYVASCREAGSRKVYAAEMTDDGHRELLLAADRCAGRVALSGYASELYAELLTGRRWWCSVAEERALRSGRYFTGDGRRGRRAAECLWTNYDPAALAGPMLFGDEE